MVIKKRGPLLFFLVAAACAGMAWVEGGLRPIYPVKSALKLLVFLGSVWGYLRLTGDRTPLNALGRPSRRTILPAAGLAVAVFALILGGYALLSPWLDLSAITVALGTKEGITAAMFPFAALYISFVNSLLEEFFFRGFAFLSALENGMGRLACPLSAVTFALYHVCILDGWFHPSLFLLLTLGLAVAGLLFNWLDRDGTLWPSWLVHLAANLATNTIGMQLFGLI